MPSDVGERVKGTPDELSSITAADGQMASTMVIEMYIHYCLTKSLELLPTVTGFRDLMTSAGASSSRTATSLSGSAPTTLAA